MATPVVIQVMTSEQLKAMVRMHEEDSEDFHC